MNPHDEQLDMKLSALLAGELTVAEAADLQAQIDADETLAAEYAELCEASSLLGLALKHEPTQPLNNEQITAILAAAESGEEKLDALEEAARKRTFHFPRGDGGRKWQWWFSVAATFVVCLSAGLMLMTTARNPKLVIPDPELSAVPGGALSVSPKAKKPGVIWVLDKTGDKGPALRTAPEQGYVELAIALPSQRCCGTPHPPAKTEPNMEPAKPAHYRRPRFYAPEGTTNLALGKDVTASEEPMMGELAQLVDGNAEATDDTILDLDSGPAWVTVDLGKPCEVFAVLSWQRHNNLFAFRDVVIETADDKDFATNRQILFNNDHDGSLGKGHGKGANTQYLENYQGKLVDARGIKARYVRFWSNGNSHDASNYWTEINIFGRELPPGPATTPPVTIVALVAMTTAL